MSVDIMTRPGNRLHLLSVTPFSRDPDKEFIPLMNALVHENCKVETIDVDFSPETSKNGQVVDNRFTNEALLDNFFEYKIPQSKVKVLNVHIQRDYFDQGLHDKIRDLIVSCIEKSNQLVELRLDRIEFTEKFTNQLGKALNKSSIHTLHIVNAKFKFSNTVDVSTMPGFLAPWVPTNLLPDMLQIMAGTKNETLSVIVQALQNRDTPTKMLDLQNYPLIASDFEVIANFVENGNLEGLRLTDIEKANDNRMDAKDMEVIFEAIASEENKLKELAFPDNAVDKADVLVKSLKDENSKLEKLDISHNPIAITSAQEILNVGKLQEFRTITDPKMSYHYYEFFEQKIWDKMDHNVTLRVLYDSFPGVRQNHEEEELLKPMFRSTALRTYINDRFDKKSKMHDYNRRVNTEWFEILLLLLCKRTRPQFYIRELVKPLALTFRPED